MVARDPADDHALQRLQSACAPVLDAAGLLSGQAIEPRYCPDWTGGEGRPLAVLRLRSPEKVALAMTRLHSLRQPVVVQGGMTGWVGNCVLQHGEVVMSAGRLRTIEALDTEACMCAGGLHTPGAKTFFSELVHSTIGQLGGSISGKHGIGLLKKKHLTYCRSAAELTLMRTLKLSLDSQQLLNRGRIFDLSPLPSLTP